MRGARPRTVSASGSYCVQILFAFAIGFFAIKLYTIHGFATSYELLADNFDIPSEEHGKKPTTTIAYAISLTSCPSKKDAYLEGAYVLQHSIHLSSIHSSSSNSQYSYKLFAFVHPQASNCSQSLADFGYEILLRDTPIDVSQIRGDFLREKVVKTGCCGEKEFIKLWSYTLLDYPIVVHLDIDTLMIHPMDELYDAMIEGPTDGGKNIPTTFDIDFPKQIDAYFTRDYNMVNFGHKHVGVQGGFFVIRPSMEVFEEYREIILEGNFAAYSGWGGKGYGGYWGAQQIQGIMSYYYDYLHPGTAVELNRCVYDAMNDNPRDDSKGGKGLCRVGGGDNCEDCRQKNISDVKLAHFTLCSKPWECPFYGEKWTNMHLCDHFFHEWFRIRHDLKNSNKKNGTLFSKATGKFKDDHFFGYCTTGGKKGYIPMYKR